MWGTKVGEKHITKRPDASSCRGRSAADRLLPLVMDKLVPVTCAFHLGDAKAAVATIGGVYDDV